MTLLDKDIFLLVLQINLDGCYKITETGFYCLLTNCKKLKTVTMVGTSVTILPKGVKNLEISLEGYPAISPDIKVLKDKGPGIISGKYRLLDSLVV